MTQRPNQRPAQWLPQSLTETPPPRLAKWLTQQPAQWPIQSLTEWPTPRLAKWLIQ
ncbi:hypothetical protein [Streptomyces sp. SID12488]|uniref:hypothetical protein n=1 Tax=Streptomyces sp. SID12488 TaxID=2706040 RepID=UPI0013DBD7BC|nr:hypothetical protein [Streptomyces sp. SID12488]NEA61850.1 hypothetical protein [Streptomyces sp. SID12488]